MEPVSFDINWANPWYAQEQCPFPRGEHCHTDHAVIRFRSYSIQFIFIWHAGVHEKSVNPIESAISTYTLGSKDAIIFNVGLHIKVEDKYLEQLRLIEMEVSRLLSTSLSTLPSIHFIETTPQHFHSLNGYYIPDINVNYTSCYPMNGTILPTPGYSRFERKNDYKNIYLEQMINKHWADQPKIGLIKTASGLYSQYDAHLGISQGFVSQGGKELADCTHWCHPSGVHNFIHLQLYNFLKKKWN